MEKGSALHPLGWIRPAPFAQMLFQAGNDLGIGLHISFHDGGEAALNIPIAHHNGGTH